MKKTKIKRLPKIEVICNSAKIILKDKINRVNASVKDFLKDDSIENLHQVRIAIRRLRYNMEIFKKCFEKKKFLVFYNIIEQLQDNTGSKRDLDVFANNIIQLSVDNDISIDTRIISLVEEKKFILNESLKVAFKEYLKGRELKEFSKLLNS
jgi:CHAD domain-containing protein